MDETAVRATLQHDLDHSAAGEEDVAHEIYREDAVLEFPQSGERFEGVEDFREWRRRYPATKVEFDVRRVRGEGDAWVVELRIRYDGGPWNYGIEILEFRDRKVARETICVMDGWEAPEWRAEPPIRRTAPDLSWAVTARVSDGPTRATTAGDGARRPVVRPPLPRAGTFFDDGMP